MDAQFETTDDGLDGADEHATVEYGASDSSARFDPVDERTVALLSTAESLR